MLNDLKSYLIERFKERSTYVGLSAFFTSLHYQYTSIILEDTMTLFVALCSLMIVFTKDK